MADAAVSFLLDNIREYLSDAFTLKSRLTTKIKEVKRGVNVLQSFLKDGQGTLVAEGTIDRELKIRDIIYEFHHVNDKFNDVLAISGFPKKLFNYEVGDLREIISDMLRIERQIRDLKEEYQHPNRAPESCPSKGLPFPESIYRFVMADGPVSSLSDSIVEYLEDAFHLQSKLTTKITEVKQVVNALQSFLKDGQGTLVAEGTIDREIKIRDIIYKFHRVNYKFNVVAISGFPKKLFNFEVRDLREISNDIWRIERQIRDLAEEFRHSDRAPEARSSIDPIQTPSNVQLPETFTDRPAEMNQLRLLMESKDRTEKFIAICGTCGIGKTAVSLKLFQEAKEKKLFEGFAWVDVSCKGLGLREILQSIYNQLREVEVGMGREMGIEIEYNAQMTDTNLAKQLNRIQSERRCLIVLNDLWSSDVWLSLRAIFPLGENYSKILITTQLREAAEKLGAKIHIMSCLTEEQGCELILKIAEAAGLPREESEEVAEMGKVIVQQCEGLPLAVIESVKAAIGQLRTERNNELYARITQGIGLKDSVLEQSALSFKNLPQFLRQCFLYLGLLEQNSQVGAEKLYMLLLADGHILHQDQDGQGILMDVAEAYLNDLAQRSMIEVQEAEVPTITRFDSCRLNPLMRQLCHVKNKEPSFFQVMDFEDSGLQDTSQSQGAASNIDTSQSQGAVLNILFASLIKILRYHLYVDQQQSPEKKIYRVSINMNNWAEHCSRLVDGKSKRIGLMLLSMEENCTDFAWPRELLDLSRFKYLKVLTFTGFPFHVTRLPYGIGMLVRLKYLSFNGCVLAQLPSSIGKLKLLEILDLRVKCKMVIPNVLQKLRELKHLYFPESIETKKPAKFLRLVGLKNLETITNVDAGVVSVDDLSGLSKLCYIDVIIPGGLVQINRVAEYITTNTGVRSLRASIKIRSHDFYTDESHSVLEQLWGYPSLIVLDMTGYIRRLPQIQGTGSNLAKIALVKSELVEDSMETLNKLPMLRVLVMEDCAYMGVNMTCSASGFKELRRLELLNLPNLEELIVEDGAMPKLSKLAIKNCGKLDMHPEKLGFDWSHQEVKISGIRNKCKGTLEKGSGTIKFE